MSCEHYTIKYAHMLLKKTLDCLIRLVVGKNSILITGNEIQQ